MTDEESVLSDAQEGGPSHKGTGMRSKIMVGSRVGLVSRTVKGSQVDVELGLCSPNVITAAFLRGVAH